MKINVALASCKKIYTDYYGKKPASDICYEDMVKAVVAEIGQEHFILRYGKYLL